MQAATGEQRVSMAHEMHNTHTHTNTHIQTFYMRTVGQFKYVGITIIIYCQAKGKQEQQVNVYICVCVASRQRRAVRGDQGQLTAA